MMKNDNYQNDLKKFWENRKQAREERDKGLAELSFSEKIAITESLQRDGRALQNAKRDTIGLSLTSPDAVNTLSRDLLFTQEDFEKALNKVFPFTRELQADQESSKT